MENKEHDRFVETRSPTQPYATYSLSVCETVAENCFFFLSSSSSLL